MNRPDHVLDQDKITKIKNLLKFRPKGLTISDISQQLKMNRNSVAKYLEILLISGHVEMRSFGAAKVFFLSNRIPISAMLSFSSDFILVLDNELHILQVNDKFLQFLRLQKESLLGKEVVEPPLSFLQEIPFATILKKKPENREFTAEISILRSGARVYFWTKVIPTVFDDGGQGLTIILEDITRQKEAQAKLMENEEKFKSIVELSPFPISIIDTQGSYQMLNKKFVEVFGYTLNDIPHGKDWFRLAFPDPVMRKNAIHLWMNDLDRSRIGEVRPRTLPVHCKDGSVREIIFRPVTLMDGTQCVVYEDVSEKRHAEQVQAFLAAIVASSQDAVIGKDLTGTVISWNRGAELIYGYTEREIIGKPITTLIPPDLLREYTEIIERVRKGEEIKHFETSRIRKDGSVVEVSISISPVRDVNGTIIAASTIARDITERKRFEQELLIRNAAIASSATAIAITGLDAIVTYVNDSFLRLFGISREELIGRSIELTAQGNYDKIREIREIAQEVRSRGVWEGEMQGSRPEGQILDFHLSANLVKETSGKPLCMIATFTDLTHIRTIEKERDLNERKIQEIIDFLPDPIFVIDTDRKVIGWNKAMADMTGVPALEILGKGDYAYAMPFYGNSRPVLVDLIDKTEAEIKEIYPDAKKVKDCIFSEVYVTHLYGGRGAYVWAKASPLFDQKGERIGAIETVRDISDWKRAEESIKKVHSRIEATIQERTVSLQEENRVLRKELETMKNMVDRELNN